MQTHTHTHTLQYWASLKSAFQGLIWNDEPFELFLWAKKYLTYQGLCNFFWFTIISEAYCNIHKGGNSLSKHFEHNPKIHPESLNFAASKKNKNKTKSKFFTTWPNLFPILFYDNRRISTSSPNCFLKSLFATWSYRTRIQTHHPAHASTSLPLPLPFLSHACPRSFTPHGWKSSLGGGKTRDPGNELAHPPVRRFSCA